MTARVVLARHGESAWNVEDRYQGQADSGLTSTGRRQAQQLARWLASGVSQRPTVVASSDLARARDTARAYTELVGATAVADRRLREVDTGDWTGRLFSEVVLSHREDVEAAVRGEDVRRGGGETFAEVRARVWSALIDLAGTNASSGATASSIVVFTHAGPIRVAAAQALGLPSPGHPTLAPPPNCSVTIIDIEPVDGGARLVQYSSPTTSGATAALAE
jgi:probable phosphoglycerate mutase